MYCQLLQDSTLLSLGCETTFWQLAGEPAFRNIGLLVVAVIGICFAIYRSVKLHQQTKTAIRQAETSEAGLNIDRFQKGAAMLGDNQSTVREAGIFILKELALQNLDNYYVNVHILVCAFLRGQSKKQVKRYKDRQSSDNETFNEIMDYDCLVGLDTLIALNRVQGAKLIAERMRKDEFHPFFDLSETNFQGLRTDGDFSYFRFDGAWFKDTILRCNFQSANFTKAWLLDADLQDCILADANFDGVDLSNAKNLTYVQLSQAKNVDPKFLAKIKADEEAAAAKAAEENSRT